MIKYQRSTILINQNYNYSDKINFNNNSNKTSKLYDYKDILVNRPIICNDNNLNFKENITDSELNTNYEICKDNTFIMTLDSYNTFLKYDDIELKEINGFFFDLLGLGGLSIIKITRDKILIDEINYYYY